MSLESPPANRTPSALWMWSFWICFAVTLAAYVISLAAPPPVYGIARVTSGASLFIGGIFQLRVVAYKTKTRGPYSTFGPYSYQIQRQMGRSAMVLGVVLAASALVGL